MNRVLPLHPPAGFRRPRNNLFVIRGGGFGQLPAMQSPLVQSGLWPAPLPSALPVAPGPALTTAAGGGMTPAGLSTPVLGLPVWFWAVGGLVVYWLFFSGGGHGAGARR